MILPVEALSYCKQAGHVSIICSSMVNRTCFGRIRREVNILNSHQFTSIHRAISM